MKKLLLVALLSISSYVMGQYNPDAPWMKNLNNQESTGRSLQRSANDKLTLGQISAAFNDYWKDKDHTVKGSGYKPFKRWEHYMESILLPDGTIPSGKQLWDNALREERRFGNSSNISNWTSTGPMTKETGQGRVNVAMVDPNNPNTYYVGAPSGGLWKSTDKGTSWEPLTDQLPEIGVSGIAIDPNDSNIIYIASGDDDHWRNYGLGVFKSTDGGRTWDTSATFTPAIGDYNDAHEIYIHPRNSNILWVATSEGLYKSIDAGKTWNRIFEGNIEDLRLKPNDPNVLYIIANDNDGFSFYKSVDGGTSFTKKFLGLSGYVPRTVIDVTPAAPENVYVLVSKNVDQSPNGFKGGIFYRSNDAGESFREVNRGFMSVKQTWYNLALGVSDIDPEKLAIGEVSGFSSIDGGLTFQHIRYGHSDVHFLRYTDGVLFCGNDGGFITYDVNDTFKDHSKQLDIGQYYKINIGDFKGTNVADIIGGTQDNGGQFFINGAWEQWHGADGMECAFGAIDTGLKYGLIQNGNYLCYKRDIDNYTNWVNGPENGRWIVAADINSKDEMYVGYNALYKFDIKTRSFEKLHDFGGAIDQVIIDDNNDEVIFVLQGGNIYKSIDAGKSFQLFYDNANGGYVRFIEVSEDNSNKIWFISWNGLYSRSTLGDISTEQPVLVSTSSELPADIHVIKHQPYSDNLYVGTQYGIFYKDASNVWSAYNNNLPNVPVFDIEISVEDNTIIAGTYGRGIWKSPIPNGNRTSCALNIPTALNAEITDEGIYLTWTAEKKLEDYEVAYRKVGDREWISKDTGVSTMLFDITEIQAGVEYEAKVRSTCNSASSEFSAVLKFTWADIEAPTAPTYFYAYDVKKTSAYLSWGDSTDNSGVSHYEIYSQTGREDVLLDRTPGPESYYNIEVLTASTEYNLYVKAVDFAGNKSEPSVIANFNTQSAFMPNAPQNLVSSNNTGTTITLNWNAPTGPEEVKAYEIYDNQLGLIGTTTETQFVVNNLPSGTWFYVYVKAVGIDDSKSDQSNDVGFILEGVNDKQPNSPANIVVVDDIYSNVVLRWDAPRGNVAISHYDVYVQDSWYYFEDFWGGSRKVGTSETTEITITSLDPYRNYWVTVVAVGTEGVMSLPSESEALSVKGDPDTVAPTVPTNLRAEFITSSGLDLVWDASTDNTGVSYYEVFEKVGERNVSIGQTGRANIVVDGLEPFTQHIYQVSATDFEGNTSELSQPIIVWTLHKQFPERPSGLKAINITADSFEAGWRSTRNTDHYYVSSYDGVTIKEFGPLLGNSYKFENIETPFLFWRVISENELGKMYSSWDLTTLDTPRGTIDVVLNGVESQQVVIVPSAYENAPYDIFNLSGVSINRGIVSEGSVDVTSLKKGVYILKIQNDLKPFTKKVVIQ
ncbi:Por secretion system C-terminal sorting domain-containing protein [Tenacibaculum sp. MAR_2009_124]|uniref:fibronectin type III domain-containing protein n=1 Tax=Tenacibaculum sp. MAR_2009_124 TaxID=1250059 RepID=UPI00089C1C10|nr:fibronectin type III domain-containing protein [Tenacibaculum sp. MAR_2009_124]SEB35595.1 Por secretion system C-terminal sorting domain-containing protein [Tenacibaculum sp. MAR_2009_124]